MNVQHQERTTCQNKILPKSTETEKHEFNVNVQETALVQSCETKQTVYWADFRFGSGRK